MKYALKLPTNWQAVKMETDLEEKIEAKPCRITQHTHTQAHTHRVCMSVCSFRGNSSIVGKEEVGEGGALFP